MMSSDIGTREALLLEPLKGDGRSEKLFVAAAEVPDDRLHGFKEWISKVGPEELAKIAGVEKVTLLSRTLPMIQSLEEAGGRGGVVAVLQSSEKPASKESLKSALVSVTDSSDFGNVEWSVVEYEAYGPLRLSSETPVGPHAKQFDAHPENTITVSSAEPRHLALVEANCGKDDQVDDFNTWYDNVHIPDVICSLGYRSAWRFELSNEQKGRARYLTFYELQCDDLAQATEVRNKRREREAGIGAYDGAVGLVAFAFDSFTELPAT